MNFDRVTVRSSKRGAFYVVEGRGVGRVTHTVPLPGEVCPTSKEPASATLTVSYRADGDVLEVVSLRRVVQQLWRESSGLEDAGMAILNALGKAVNPDCVTLSVVLKDGATVELTW